MLKNIAISAAMASVILLSAGGAFAADAAAAAPAKAKTEAAAPALSKEQVKDIKMTCKKDKKDDKAAYKACVKEKEEAAVKEAEAKKSEETK